MTLPLPRNEQHLAVSLKRPGAAGEEPLDVTFISADRRGVAANGLLSRGVYRVTGKRLALVGSDSQQPVAWEVPIVVNGAAEESDLTPLARSEFDSAYSTMAWPLRFNLLIRMRHSLMRRDGRGTQHRDHYLSSAAGGVEVPRK